MTRHWQCTSSCFLLSCVSCVSWLSLFSSGEFDEATRHQASDAGLLVAIHSFIGVTYSLSPASNTAVGLKPPSSFAPFLIANSVDLFEMNSVLLADTGVL